MAAEQQRLLRVVVHQPDWVPPVMALCAGYELQQWRLEALANEVSSWLPSFVLPWSEQQQMLGSSSAVQSLRRAAQLVYDTDKYGRRGEWGEIVLHGILRQEFGTEAAVSKFWFKDSRNDTVKGFDVVHISDPDRNGLHLWLGEAKYYKDLSAAVRDAIAELKQHLAAGYLRNELMLVSNKIDPSAPFAADLERLLDEKTSLDEIFSVLHIPVLLTYESEAVANHDSHCEEYFQAVESEVRRAWEKFASDDDLRKEVVVHVVMLPLLDKDLLTERLHDRLLAWLGI